MNKPLLAAAIISALTVLLHVFGGGPQYHAPALLSNFTVEEKALYSVLWFTGPVAPCQYFRQSLRLASMTQSRQSMSIHPMTISDRRSPFIKTIL